jgi:hypothetical protein
MKKTPRQYSLVKFDYSSISSKFHNSFPFTEKGIYVFLGEIPNMLGHCIIIDHKTGQIFSGYHIENFREVTEDEF